MARFFACIKLDQRVKDQLFVTTKANISIAAVLWCCNKQAQSTVVSIVFNNIDKPQTAQEFTVLNDYKARPITIRYISKQTLFYLTNVLTHIT